MSTIPSYSGLFLTRHAEIITSQVTEGAHFIKPLAIIVTEYICESYEFGQRDWKDYINLQTIETTLPPYIFYKFWFAEDCEDPKLLNCDTHIITFIPKSLRIFALYKFTNIREIFSSIEVEKFENHEDCWVAMRKKCFNLGADKTTPRKHIEKLNQKSHLNYEKFPSSIHIATSLVTHFAKTQEVILNSADDKGNGTFFYSVCYAKETPGKIYPFAINLIENGLTILTVDKVQQVSLGILGVKKFT